MKYFVYWCCCYSWNHQGCSSICFKVNLLSGLYLQIFFIKSRHCGLNVSIEKPQSLKYVPTGSTVSSEVRLLINSCTHSSQLPLKKYLNFKLYPQHAFSHGTAPPVRILKRIGPRAHISVAWPSKGRRSITSGAVQYIYTQIEKGIEMTFSQMKMKPSEWKRDNFKERTYLATRLLIFDEASFLSCMWNSKTHAKISNNRYTFFGNQNIFRT